MSSCNKNDIFLNVSIPTHVRVHFMHGYDVNEALYENYEVMVHGSKVDAPGQGHHCH